ncbi:MAG: DUF2225 domain-containing protein [Spirochaetes bacterium]|nr:DUF2225 domain-containing protein [Spirochaetota bacterium]
MAEDRELKVSFISKKETECPVCEAHFFKEEMLTGGGRLIAGSLTQELHRLYDPSLKYGELFPLVYNAFVCPECLYASSDADFPHIPSERIRDAQKDRQTRRTETERIFPGIDFSESHNRGLMEGAASQYLVLRCYDYFQKDASPTIKQGIAALRCAWLLDELDKKHPGAHYDWLATLFRKKAQFCYNEALQREQEGTEIFSIVKNLGPDTDKNYSYEGVLYMCAYLRAKYGPSHDMEQRKNSLEDAKRTISKLFGMGKASKDRPSSFLELAKKVHAEINKNLAEEFPQ